MQAFTDLTTLHRNPTGSHLHNHRINCHHGRLHRFCKVFLHGFFPHVSAYALKQSDLIFQQVNSRCMNTPSHATLHMKTTLTAADAAAAELVRLYVQKGHNHQACHRFLKKAPTTATCVCPPVGKGFPTATSTFTFQPLTHRQGDQASRC